MKDSLYYYGLGVEAIEKNNYSEAIDNFLKSLAIRAHFKTYERLYYCYLNLGMISKSKECIEKAYKLNDKNDKVSVEYSQILFKEGLFDEALEILQCVLLRNPSYGPAKKLLKEFE